MHFELFKYIVSERLLSTNLKDNASRRVLWQSKSNSKTEAAIPFDGVPYALVGTYVLECQHGVDRNIYQKNKHASKFKVFF